jgi:uncharacterized protein
LGVISAAMSERQSHDSRIQRAVKLLPRWRLALVGLFLGVAVSATAAGQGARPSFDCRAAKAPDEYAICSDSRLAELDQAVSIAYGEIEQRFMKEGVKSAKEILAARHACGTNRLCILDQQVRAIEAFSEFGSKVPVPPWVGAYRIALFRAGQEPALDGIPTRIGQCSITKVASISSRFGGELKHPTTDEMDTGAAVSYANRGYQVSYSYVESIANSQIGDEVLLCLVSIPKNCPPGDSRGRFYSATNLRTKGSWLLPDAQHICGGA